MIKLINFQKAYIDKLTYKNDKNLNNNEMVVDLKRDYIKAYMKILTKSIND